METKSNDSPIDKIKVLENSINELNSIVRGFIQKKSQRFKNFFNQSKNKKSSNTIDDADLGAHPVIIDRYDIQEIRTRINSLETKLNLFIESLENKNEQNKEQYDNLKNTVEDIVEEIKREHNDRVEQIEKLKNELEHGIIMYD